MADGETFTLQAGPLHIRLERWRDEFHYASERAVPNRAAPAAGNGNQTTEWKRWICGNGPVTCRLKPLPPPRAVVVRPAMPLQIIPGAAVELFVSIPVWVRVCLTMDDKPTQEISLFEEPTVVLSNSWFGTPVDGELCYASKTRARRRLEELRPDAHLAVCPLTLRNESAEPLIFERLCVRLQYVSLYAGDTHLWTNHGVLDYRGEDSASSLRFADGPPTGDGVPRQLAEPRDTYRRGGAQRALDSIRNMSSRWGVL